MFIGPYTPRYEVWSYEGPESMQFFFFLKTLSFTVEIAFGRSSSEV